MSKKAGQVCNPFTGPNHATAWMLASVILIPAITLQGQTRPETNVCDLAIKTVLQLGGQIRYADQFMSGKERGFWYPNRDPLAEYVNMKCPPRAVAPQKDRSGKPITNAGPRQVVQIDLSGTKPTDEELARLAAFPQLRVLLLNGATVSDENLRHLAQFHDLEVLDLSSTQVKGTGLSHLAKLTRLKELRLIETGVDDEGLVSLAGLKNLETLSLGSTKVSDRGLERLAANTKLSELRIDDAAATEKGVDRFRHAHRQCRVFHEHWFDPLDSPPEEPEPKDENKESSSKDPFEESKPEKKDAAESSHDTPKKHQPVVWNISPWDGRIVAECLGLGNDDMPKIDDRLFFTIDVKKTQAAPLSLPGGGKILSLAAAGPSNPLALCLRDGKKILLRKEKDAWLAVNLPEQALRKPTLALEANSHDLVLLTENEFFLRRDDHWTVRQHVDGDRFLNDRRHELDRYVISGDSLYRAVNRGEFGGGLYRLDLTTGKWSHIPATGPTRDVKIDPQGRLWAVDGISHLGGISGAISVQQSDGWKTVVSIENFQRRKIGWNLGYTDPRSIAFDAHGGIYVIASPYGICHYEGRRWKPFLYPGQRECDDFSLYFVGSDLAVVGTVGSGVFLCRLDTGDSRQVLLLPSDGPKGPKAVPQ
jgi:hypothetical protein